MHLCRIIPWALVACFAACDLEVRSTAPQVVVPVGLEGLWIGTWQSDSAPGGSVSTPGITGNVEIRIQEFGGEPLVSVTIDNPCLVPRNYDLRLTAEGIDLLADGEVVLNADRAGSDRLIGRYQCEQDQGMWTADRVGSLPSLLDLTGAWEGRIVGPAATVQPVELDLVQTVEAGQLVVRADAVLPGVLPFPLPLEGIVRFRESDFELVMQSEPGAEPQLIISGVGDREPLQLPVGFVQVLSANVLPFSQGMIELVPVEPEP